MTKLADLPRFAVGNTIQLVGAIYAGTRSNGDPELYLCPVPGEQETLVSGTTNILNMDASEWDDFLQRTDLQEVEVTDGERKAILRKTQRIIDSTVSWNCFRRDNYKCSYCGRNDVPLTVDHLVLWESGGPSIESNLLTCCRKCNRTRGNATYESWLSDPYYLRVSSDLSPERIVDNFLLSNTLHNIRRESRIKSR